MKQINFYAGPSYLDEELMQEAIALLDNKNKLSLLEISHRSDIIVNLFEETKALLKSMMKLDDDKEILFLHGGASLQFGMVAMNMAGRQNAGFVDTGVWTKKAIKEAQKIRNVKICASGEADRYNVLPNIDSIDTSDIDYLHIASNNTIYGTQYHSFPKIDKPLVVDMSSDILSRKLDFNAFDLIFAGFQKNLGTAGGCLVILNKKILETQEKNLLSMLNYRIHINANSMFNTPPVFSVLMCNLSLKWIIKQGGLEVVELKNKAKAEILYSEIDRNTLFYSSVDKNNRSIMNVCFEAKEEKLEHDFLQKCAAKNIVGIKGHRVKGGFRASLYNAMPLSAVEYLVSIMQEFEEEQKKQL